MNLDSLPVEIRCAVEAAQNKLAYGITVLDLRELGAFTNHFLICSAASTPQTQAIADEIDMLLEKRGARVLHREGYNTGRWVLLDYGGFIVHIFHEQSRLFFDLERLWRSAKRLEIPDATAGAAATR